MTNDLGIRLKTSTLVTIPPHNITVILLEPLLRPLQWKSVNTKLLEVIGNPMMSIEQPYLLIFCTLHKFNTRYLEQCVAIAANVSDKDILLNKGMTLCFIQKTDLTMKIPHVKDVDTVNTVHKEDMVDTKRVKLENSS